MVITNVLNLKNDFFYLPDHSIGTFAKSQELEVEYNAICCGIYSV
jgi:hypothetical protein